MYVTQDGRLTRQAHGMEESLPINMLTFRDYLNRLTLMARSIFEWHNLPYSVSERYLEEALFYYGKAVFVNDKTMGILGLKCVPSGEINVYDEPTYLTAYSINYNKQYKREDCVYIRNNDDCFPTRSTIQLFAQRLYEIERTIDVNVKGQKFPIMIKCNEKERLTFKNLMAKYDGNEPFIYGTDNIDIGGIAAIKTDSPYVADKLTILKHNIWNEAMTFLGIKNANMDKRERLVTDEVDANDEQTSIAAQTMLISRQRACDEYNRLFKPEKPIFVTMREFSNSEMEETGG